MIKEAIKKARKIIHHKRALTADEIQHFKGIGFHLCGQKRILHRDNVRINVLTGYVFEVVRS